MKGVGYFLVAFALFLYYEGFKGRALTDVGTDIADLSKALVTFDFEEVEEVVTRTGTLVDAGTVGASVGSVAGSVTGTQGVGSVAAQAGAMAGTSAAGLQILQEAKRLGSAAKGYRLGATGPTYYDCSGLYWRAMKNVGYYNGARFVTRTVGLQLKNRMVKVDVPAVGDLLVWKGHMGMMDGANSVYHAASPKSGIKSADMAGLIRNLQSRYGNVTFYRLK